MANMKARNFCKDMTTVEEAIKRLREVMPKGTTVYYKPSLGLNSPLTHTEFFIVTPEGALGDITYQMAVVIDAKISSSTLCLVSDPARTLGGVERLISELSFKLYGTSLAFNKSNIMSMV